MGNPRLENWSVKQVTNSPYEAPELGFSAICGEVYNHPVPRHYDGKKIQTSRVKSINLDTNIAQTNNTTYELGTPSQEWLDWMKENGYELRQYHKP